MIVSRFNRALTSAQLKIKCDSVLIRPIRSNRIFVSIIDVIQSILLEAIVSRRLDKVKRLNEKPTFLK